jgi:chemotaxis protein MotB
MKHIGMIVVVAAALAVSAGCSNKDLIKQKDAQIGDLQSQVTTLNQKVDDLNSQVDQQQKMSDELKSSLADLERQNKVLIQQKDGLTHITLDGAATFGTAQAWLTADARNTLDRIWNVLQNYPDRRILIEGHTDNRPIAMSYREHFASNWELSTARANAVLHYLAAKHQLDTSRVAAVGYGPSVPVADNATAAGRAQNRRVVITVGSQLQIEQRVSQAGAGK